MNKTDFNFINPGAEWCSVCGNPRVGCTCDPDPTPVVLPWWVNNEFVILTDGETKRKVRTGDSLYRVLIANGWTEVTR